MQKNALKSSPKNNVNSKLRYCSPQIGVNGWSVSSHHVNNQISHSVLINLVTVDVMKTEAWVCLVRDWVFRSTASVDHVELQVAMETHRFQPLSKTTNVEDNDTVIFEMGSSHAKDNATNEMCATLDPRSKSGTGAGDLWTAEKARF